MGPCHPAQADVIDDAVVGLVCLFDLVERVDAEFEPVVAARDADLSMRMSAMQKLTLCDAATGSSPSFVPREFERHSLALAKLE